nr:hypothetical protein [Tanacetum cinerariifolium]
KDSEKCRLRGNQAYSDGDLAKAEDSYIQGLNYFSLNGESRSFRLKLEQHIKSRFLYGVIWLKILKAMRLNKRSLGVGCKGATKGKHNSPRSVYETKDGEVTDAYELLTIVFGNQGKLGLLDTKGSMFIIYVYICLLTLCQQDDIPALSLLTLDGSLRVIHTFGCAMFLG